MMKAWRRLVKYLHNFYKHKDSKDRAKVVKMAIGACQNYVNTMKGIGSVMRQFEGDVPVAAVKIVVLLWKYVNSKGSEGSENAILLLTVIQVWTELGNGRISTKSLIYRQSD